MNVSQTLRLGASAALILVAGPVLASNDAPAAEVSRSEVIADTMIWRDSGLAEQQSGDAGNDPTLPAFIAALDRYHAMKASPQFALLVDRIARQRGERGQATASVQR